VVGNYYAVGTHRLQVAIMSVRHSLFRYLDEQPSRTITAWNLFDVMEARTGRKTMPATLLSYTRLYCAYSGATLACINPQESRYRYEPGAKIAGALDYAKD